MTLGPLPLIATLGCAALASVAGAQAPAFRLISFQPDQPIARAGRPATVLAVIESASDADLPVTAILSLPEGLSFASGEAALRKPVAPSFREPFTWRVVAAAPGDYTLGLTVTAPGCPPVEASLNMGFLQPMPVRQLEYIPEPVPAAKPLLVGAHHCPLWEADKPHMWDNIIKHPERTPALGFYDQANPEVSDWETKWAVEHGISFFIYCWYRTSQGGPVETMFSSAINEALHKSRFQDKMKYTIMWENQSRGRAGVSDEQDLMQNLLPYWMETYFKHPSYLKVDNKPVLFIYRPEFLVDDLGGVDKVQQAFEKMRQAARDAGFDGLYLLGEYRGTDPNHLNYMRSLGLDYTFAYCWYVGNNPTPQQSIDAQMSYIRQTQDLNILPQVVTVSQAWSGWADEGTIWKIPPKDFESLLTQARDFVKTLPADQLSSQMLLLDNWNEWGEGHYIAPYREYGFGYLDAVRKVIAGDTSPHDDLIPDDIGMGPYDTAYREWAAQTERSRRMSSLKATKPGAPEDGLVGWWAFDEDLDAPVAVDYSGNRRGGMLQKASRAPGIDGNALVCAGGCALVESNPALSLTDALSVEAWARTDEAGQGNTWILNRVFSGGTDTGYRLGVVSGKPCFEVPQTSFSHHLSADIDLPTGRWVHLVGTFDGQVMRLYVDGELHGTMDRPGPAKPNEFHLCLGNFELNHSAYFRGLIDEVKLYSRALSPDEVREHFTRLSARAAQ